MRDLVTGKVWEGRPASWVQARSRGWFGSSVLSFPGDPLCCCGGLKFSTEALRVSHQQALRTLQFCLEPTPSPASLFQGPGLGLSSPPPGPSEPGEGRVPAVITLLGRIIRPGPGWHQQNSPSYTFLYPETQGTPTDVVYSSHETCVRARACAHTWRPQGYAWALEWHTVTKYVSLCCCLGCVFPVTMGVFL